MSLVYRCVRKIGYLLRLRLEPTPGRAWRWRIAFLAALARLHGWTLRYRVQDKAGYLDGRFSGSVILLLWHNRIFSMPYLYARVRQKQRPRALVLTSVGPEGSLLELFMSYFGLGAVRGSTSRRASMALREMTARLAEGHDIMITPDGPLGPRYRLQPGALSLARHSGCPILPVHIEYSHFRRFNLDGSQIDSLARLDVTSDPHTGRRKEEEEFGNDAGSRAHHDPSLVMVERRPARVLRHVNPQIPAPPRCRDGIGSSPAWE